MMAGGKSHNRPFESKGRVFESPRARSLFPQETSHLVSVVTRA